MSTPVPAVGLVLDPEPDEEVDNEPVRRRRTSKPHMSESEKVLSIELHSQNLSSREIDRRIGRD